MQIQREGMRFERLTFDDLTTTGNAYVNVPFHFPNSGSDTRSIWSAEKIISKIFYFKATDNDLYIKILASDDEGDTFPIIAHAETLVAVGSPVRVVMGNYYGHLKVQVKPAVGGAHGTLSAEAYGFSNPNMTDVEISADTSGLATGAKQDVGNGVLADILTKQTTIEGEISLRDIGSSVRITNDATSKSVSVPATAKAFGCQAEGGDVRLEIDGAASAASTIRVPEDAWIFYPISGGSQTLFSYGLAGTYSNVRFLA